MSARIVRPTLSALALLVAVWVPMRTARADEPLTVPPRAESMSGYDRIPAMGGPDSVTGALRRHDVDKEAFYRGHAIKDLRRGAASWRSGLE